MLLYQYLFLGAQLALFLITRSWRVPKALWIWLLFGAGAQTACLSFVKYGWYGYPVRPTWFQNFTLVMTAANIAFLAEALGKEYFRVIVYFKWSSLVSYVTWYLSSPSLSSTKC